MDTGKEEEINRIDHSGEHHHFELAADQKGNIVSGGLALFANNGGGAIGVENGKPKGQVAYVTADHTLKLAVDASGLSGVFKDKKTNTEILLRKGGAAEVSGPIPPEGITIQQSDGNHRIKLTITPDGKVTGNITATANENSSFDINLSSGRVVEAKYRHKGSTHDLYLVGDSEGHVGVGMQIGNLKFEASNKRGGSVFAKFNMRFG